MSVRRLIVGVATTSVVAASLALAAPAQADPAFVPAATDVIGGGSDTTMYALSYLADGHNGVPGFNAAATTGRLVSWDAVIKDASGAQTNSATIVPEAGAAAITRPNGSTSGKNLLYGAGNNAAFDYARSSSFLKDAEIAAGLFAIPFAKDTLALATAKVSNAPATISPADMVRIYKGEVTNWSELGGAAGTIVPMIPQSGSGTLDFFETELKAANGGAAVTLAPSVQRVQEHDPAPVKDNPNAVAPFSIGRNTVSGSLLRIEGGFVAARALYNVVRQADVAKAEIGAIFGAAGFVCSAPARPLIEAAGFEQLARADKGGVCGQPTQVKTTNLATNTEVATSTTLAGSSTVAGGATLTATVAASSAPDGLVSFFEGATLVGTSPLTGGKATKALTGVTAGAHTYVAKYVPPANSTFVGSASGPVTVNVLATTPAPPVATKASTKLVEKFKASYPKAASYKGKVRVKESASGAATGKIIVKLGKKKVGKGTVKAGKVILKLKKLKKGKNKLTATYKGDSKFAGSKLKFKITVK
ncbi:Ig-like domain repeat protein [Nocardioides allogilvus]|uniref:Ig-like domain repeat protein n=1 Tax=Nocardioides allogilvus TaxID=2072017 RepID=UPI000D2F7129|nr:Ig-like domain repeat protein [Nocardioides allogilvus]